MSGARRIDDALRRGDAVTVFIDGSPVAAFAGESLAAVMMAAGVRAGRRSARRAEPRGYYCGMGVCSECLVAVDGVAGVRACTTPARDGMQVATGTLGQHHALP